MLPHITNSKAGVNRYEPATGDLFEVAFTIPSVLEAEFGSDVALLTEQVQKISGLGTLDKGPDVITQKFMGTTRTYLKNKVDSTSHELKVTFALNLRNGTDNYVYKLLKAWHSLGYNMSDGTTALKNDYVASFMRVVVGNRAGDIFREIIYKDVFIKGDMPLQDELSYESNDPLQIEVTFVSDWAEERNA